MLHIHVIIEVVSHLFVFFVSENYTYDEIGHQNSERNDVNQPPNRENNNRGGRGNNNPNRGYNNNRGKANRAPPFDNKYGVDLSLCKS